MADVKKFLEACQKGIIKIDKTFGNGYYTSILFFFKVYIPFFNKI